MTDSGSGSDSPRGKGARRKYRQFRKVGYRPVAEGAEERSAESAAERSAESAAKGTAESAAEHSAESAAKGTAESAAERSAESAAKGTAESAAERTAESAAERTAEIASKGSAEGSTEGSPQGPAKGSAESAVVAETGAAGEAPRHLAADEAGSRRGTPEPGTPASHPTQEVRQDRPASKPTAEAPQPAVAAPPALGQPTTSQPTTGQPTTGQPTTGQPTTGQPAPAQVATATLPPPSPWQGPPRYPNPSVVTTAPGVPLMPWWQPPTTGAPMQVMVAGLIAGLAGAFLAPPGNGIGWFLAGLCAVGAVLFYAGKPSVERALWLAAALAFLAMGFLRAAEWIFPLCVLASMVCGSLAMAGGKTVKGLVFGGIGVGLAALRSIPWVVKGFSRRGPIGIRPFVSAGVAGVLLLVFGSLLAGADKGFNDFLEALVPDLEVGVYVRMGFFGVVAALGALGACYLVAAPPSINEDAEAKPGTLRLKDYGLPVGVLVLLFTGFVGTQLAVLFGGEAYVMKTAGVTFAEYARSGFWQLLWVTILTLGVIAGVARFAVKKTARDQLWLRVLLGSLAVLTLVIVASALSRMWFYQQAYGWTVLRLLVASCEVWLAVVYVMVIAGGITLRANWLPKAIVATGTAAFLAVVVMNPERVVADYNVSRFEATQKIDTEYLSRLSEDVVPALVRLPEPQRSCALRWLKNRYHEEDWREFNLARHNARKSLESVAVTEVTCESSYSGER